TPPINGSILEGVTRSSILTLLGEAGRQVHERPILLAELRAGLADGSVREVFACGTAAVVTPIGRLAGEAFDLTVAEGGGGTVTGSGREERTDIEYGRAADPHGWLKRLVWPGAPGRRTLTAALVTDGPQGGPWGTSSVAGAPSVTRAAVRDATTRVD